IKREILVGELSRPKDAALSVFAAVGGMAIPALIYTSLNWNGEGLSGWGIPMATDIAFALGVLSLLGNRVPLSLKVFLTALAIVDDLGAVAVIAVFYTAHLQISYLLYSFVFLAAAFVFARAGGRRLSIFLLIGVAAWYFMLKSGVHATVAGVLLAFAVPMSRKLDPRLADAEMKQIVQQGSFEEIEVKVEHLEKVLHQAHSPLHRLEHALQPWTVYFVMPVFAFFNAGVMLAGSDQFVTPVAMGCLMGLLLGKPIGVFVLSWAAVKLGFASLPQGVRWPQIFAVGVLAGIGFTMSFFIAGLAFDGVQLLDQSKIGVLSASILAAVAGLLVLYLARSPQSSE
ncbi:MAG: Na+/H+ antiporter NhaA, partial [Candidatus Hinthialibacter sp.]